MDFIERTVRNQNLISKSRI